MNWPSCHANYTKSLFGHCKLRFCWLLTNYYCPLKATLDSAMVVGYWRNKVCCSSFTHFSCFLFPTEGLSDVILYHQPDDKKKNRGFCFLEYEDHKTAAQARRRLMSGKVKVWGNVVTVEWADPIEDPDPEVMAKVRLRFLQLHNIYMCDHITLNVTSFRVVKICTKKDVFFFFLCS